MFRISEKASTILSLIFTGAALALLVVLTCTLPSIVGWYLAMTERPELDRTAITVLLYIALVPAYAAALALLALLRKVQRDEIFTQKAVGHSATFGEDSIQYPTGSGDYTTKEPQDTESSSGLYPGNEYNTEDIVVPKFDQTSSGGGSDELAQIETGYFTEAEIKEDKSQ